MSLPDGDYILTCTVENPLPARLHSRRRGWMRVEKWHKNTHFTVEGGELFAAICRGTAHLSPSQKRKVGVAIRPHLQPWVATLPSELVPYGDCDEVLDILFGLGQLTLDDVRNALQTRKALTAIAHGLQDLCDPGDPPVATGVPATLPSAQRPDAIVGCVFEPLGAPGCVVYLDTPEDGIHPGYGPAGDPQSFMWRLGHDARLVGHVADMLATGLGALATGHFATPSAILGYDMEGDAVRVGDILTCHNDPNIRLLVTSQEIVDPTHPATNKGPYVTFRYLSGSGVGFDHVSLCVGNKWIRVAPSPIASAIQTLREQAAEPEQSHFKQPYQAGSAIDPFSLD